ncbi:MAG: hypothetical protein ACYDBU_09280 [Vulcanimicrobiaceae bacterium]
MTQTRFFIRLLMAATFIVMFGIGLTSPVRAANASLTSATTQDLLPKKQVVAQGRAPKTKATPKPFTYSGYFRSYYFTRQNASAGIPVPNQAAFNAALSLHGEYRFANSPFSLGATYVYANPLGANGACSNAANYTPAGSCQPAQFSRVDTTLPAFGLSTLGEAYVKYQQHGLFAKVGNQLYNTAWANASDSRMKPVFFQGAVLGYQLNRDWSVSVSRMIRWENRVSSLFDKSTLLTSPTMNPTSGWTYGDVKYAPKRSGFSAMASVYQFTNIANLFWFDGRFTMKKSRNKPYLAVQYGSERNAGSALVGQINSNVFGAQIGEKLNRNIALSLGYDNIPWRTGTLAGGCPINYFLPSGGSPACAPNANGTFTYAYGGLASPYTFGYATDPLFTTSMTQGMADRGSAGMSYKLAAVLTTNNKRFRAILSAARYDYSNVIALSRAAETDVDFTYFFNTVRKGPYRGWSLRDRWGARTATNLPFASTLPYFVYNRTQLEYDF